MSSVEALVSSVDNDLVPSVKDLGSSVTGMESSVSGLVPSVNELKSELVTAVQTNTAGMNLD